MKMKHIAICLSILFFSLNAFAQEDSDAEKIQKHIKLAQEYLEIENNHLAADELQNAINVINDAIAASILDEMPAEIEDMSANSAEDQILSMGMLMGAGLNITRVYYNDDGQVVTVTITPNSPQLSSVVTFLENPEEYGDEIEAGRSVKINDEMKAMLKFQSQGESNFAYMQLPVNNTLMTFTGNNIEKEQDMIDFAKKFDYEKLSTRFGPAPSEE